MFKIKKNIFKAVVIKKHYFIIMSLFLCILAAYVICSINWATKETMALPMSGKVILIDPGHGGIDAGAVANDAVEKEINLKISKILQGYIEESGGVAILTRTEDSNTADPQRAKGISQKMSDLKERKKDIEDFDADIFISVHMNKFQQSQYKGAQVFYTDDESGESKRLGETIQQSIKDTVDDNNNRKAKPSGNSIYVLKGNTVPSALIECGFLSNSQEAALLKTEDYQRRIAWGIYLGISRFLSH